MSKEPDQIFPDVDRAKNGYLADKMHKALRTLTTRYVLLSRNFFEVEEMKASKNGRPYPLSYLVLSPSSSLKVKKPTPKLAIRSDKEFLCHYPHLIY